jgi:hypothetical protein
LARRGLNGQEAGENFIMRKFIICTQSTQENEMTKECSTNEEKLIYNIGGNARRKETTRKI